MNDVHFSSAATEWATPRDFFKKLDDEFRFTLDPCSTDENAKCENHYTKEQDGLAQDWTGETVFCNPPYGREMPKWIKKCYEHFIGGGNGGNVNSCPDRHQGISRIHLWQGRNPFYQRTVEVWRCLSYRAISVNGSCISKQEAGD